MSQRIDDLAENPADFLPEVLQVDFLRRRRNGSASTRETSIIGAWVVPLTLPIASERIGMLNEF